MKKHIYLGLILLTSSIFFNSCITHHDYGPHGRDGRAYFGINYDWSAPYSYWDNNPAVPNNPFFGEYYRTHSGTYSFEYFINQYEYWYGTYQIWINAGEPGQPYNQPGRDGADNYLMLICNPEGFYFERLNECGCVNSYRSGDKLIVEGTADEARFRIEMTLTTIDKRTPQEPKYMKQK